MGRDWNKYCNLGCTFILIQLTPVLLAVGGNSEKYIDKESTREDNESRGHHGSQKFNLFVS